MILNTSPTKTEQAENLQRINEVHDKLFDERNKVRFESDLLKYNLDDFFKSMRPDVDL